MPYSGAGLFSICRSCRVKILNDARASSILTAKRINHRQLSTLAKNDYLPEQRTVRTRFAPSPTGYLHLGSLRTALFNYLLARRTQGQFLLRVEDTDQKRTIPDAEQRLFEDLRWAGIEWDEGPDVGGPYGPYRQSERTELYKSESDKLLDSGHAYRCFCTAEKLHDMAAQRDKIGLSSSYDRTCASISKPESDERAARGEKHVLRFRAPRRLEALAWEDLIYGKIRDNRSNSLELKQNPGYAFDDFVLIKSDGHPTYHLANVVDDHHMGITHVVRGTEWMVSTPKHVALYDAFGWPLPHFAHVGLLLNADGTKLSKRNNDVDIKTFREQGILPEALTNFVALLGWSGYGDHGQFLPMEKLKQIFNMRWPKNNPIVDMGKLQHLQKRYAIAGLDSGLSLAKEIVESIVREADDLAGSAEEWDHILDGRDKKGYVRDVLKADAKNYTTPKAFVEGASYFFRDFPATRESVSKMLDEFGPNTRSSMNDLLYRLQELPEHDWLTGNVKAIVDEVIRDLAARATSTDDAAAEGKVATKAIYQCLRSALTDGRHGAPLCDAMVILQKRVCLERIKDWLYFTEDMRPGLDFVME